jgi:hypothetical protein
MNIKSFGLLFSCFLFVVISCKKPLQTTSYYDTNYATGVTSEHHGLAIRSGKENYPIDVFFKPDKPSFEVESIESVTLTEEEANSYKEKLVKGRMVQRGKTADEKKILVAALVEKAQNLGATCLYDINYQYYTTTKVSGFVITGIAGRYALTNIKN